MPPVPIGCEYNFPELRMRKINISLGFNENYVKNVKNFLNALNNTKAVNKWHQRSGGYNVKESAFFPFSCGGNNGKQRQTQIVSVFFCFF